MKETKKLYRSNTNKTLAGICGGIGEYFSIDPVILRVIWIFVTIFSGVVPGVAVYILAIFVIPERGQEKIVDAEFTVKKD